MEPDRNDSERSQHEVNCKTVRHFEVRGDVRRVGCLARRQRVLKPQTLWGHGMMPVINVSWADAKRYVAWFSRVTAKEYRLLNEAE